MAGFGFTSTNWCVWFPQRRDIRRKLNRELAPEQLGVWFAGDLAQATARAEIEEGVVIRADVAREAFDDLVSGALVVPEHTASALEPRAPITSIEQLVRRDP